MLAVLLLQSRQLSLVEVEDSRTITAEEPVRGLFSRVRSLWCRHRETLIVERTEAMPAHTVCRGCGWREPVEAAPPKAYRTWDSTRDEARYQREKRRRDALALQRQAVEAERAGLAARDARPRRSGLVELARTAAH